MLKKTGIKAFIGIFVLGLAVGALASETAPDKALASALQAYATKTKTEVKSFESRQAAFVDLNGDGVKDALVLLQGPDWCGTGGCTLLIFQGVGQKFKSISSSTLIRGPLLISDHKTKGWRDLVVEVSGGGMAPKKVAMKFNGHKYPSNPSVLPALPKNINCSGQTVFHP
jgi:hypothetical protein